MNKIYKTKYNAALDAWVAVPEIAKSAGKKVSGHGAGDSTKVSHSTGLFRLAVLVASIVSALGLSVPSFAYQAGGGSASSSESVAIGQDASAIATQVVAIGKNAGSGHNTSDKKQADWSVYIGYNAGVGGNHKKHHDGSWGSLYIGQDAGKNVDGDASIAIGSTSGMTHEGSQNIFIGDTAKPFTATIVQTNNKKHTTKTFGNRNIVLGNQYVHTKVKENEKGKTNYINDVIAVGTLAVAEHSQGIAIGSSRTDEIVGAYSKGERSIAIGVSKNENKTGAQALEEDAVALGTNSQAKSISSIALGAYSVANRAAISTAAVSSNATSAQNQVYGIGTNTTGIANTVKGNLGAFSVGNANSTRQIINVAAGSEDTDAVNIAQLKAVASAISTPNIHYFSVKSSDSSNRDNDGATGTDAIAIGPGASATALKVLAIGNKAGNNTKQGEASVYLGWAAGTNGNHRKFSLDKYGSVYIGQQAGQNVTGDATIGIGSTAGQVHEGSQNIFIGDTAKTFTAKNVKDEAISEKTYGNRNIVLGNQYVQKNIKAAEKGKTNYINDVISIGTLAVSEKSQGIAIGSSRNPGVVGAYSKGARSIAIGVSADEDVTGAQALEEDAVALGTNSQAKSISSIALGAYSVADRGTPSESGYDVSTGQASTETGSVWRATHAAVSVGNGTTVTRQITSVAAGSEDTDAVNVAQLKAVASAIGSSDIHYFSVNDKAANSLPTDTDNNKSNYGARGENALAAGVGAKADHDNTIAIGLNSRAGKNIFANTDPTREGWGKGAIAIGNNASSRSTNSIVIGNGASSAANNSGSAVVIGTGASANASGIDSIAIGSSAQVSNHNSVAIGNSAKGGLYGAAYGSLAQSTGLRSVAIGPVSKAIQRDTAALGPQAQATFVEATAVGSSSISSALSSTSLGRASKSNKAGAVAIGAYSQAYRAVLNNASVSDAPSVSLNQVYSLATADQSDKDAVRATVKGAYGAVSVGNADNTRQIINVAAGSEDTDAVNVAQLRSVANTPITFTGNANADTDANGTQQQLGSELSIIGSKTAVAGLGEDASNTAVEGTYSAKNLQTVVTDNQVQVQLAENPEFNSAKVASVGTDDTAVTNKKYVDEGRTQLKSSDSTVTITHDANTNTYDLSVDTSQIKNIAAQHSSVSGTGPITVTKLQNNNSNGGDDYQVSVSTTTITNNDGVSTATDPNALVKANDIVTAINNAAWQTKAGTGTDGGSVTGSNEESIKAGDEVIFDAGKNIKLVQNGKKFTYATKDDVSFTTTTVGSVVTGNNKITGLENGGLSKNSSDAVNGSQLYAMGDSTAAALGGTSSFNPTTGKVTANLKVGGTTVHSVQEALDNINSTASQGFTIAGNSDNGSSNKTIASGETLTIVGADTNNDFSKSDQGKNIYTQVSDDKKITVALAKDLKGLDSVSADKVTAGSGANQVELGDDGVKVGGNTYINNDGINANNKVISNVAAGVKDTDAVNVKQLNALSNSVTNTKTEVKEVVTVVGGNKPSDAATDAQGNAVKDANGKPIDVKVALKTYNVSDQKGFVNNSVVSAIHNMNEEGIKFFHTNDDTRGSQIPEQDENNIDASAAGARSTAIGYKATIAATADDSIAIGSGSKVTDGAEKSIAIGQASTVSGLSSIAIGTGHVVNGSNSGTFGDPNIVNGNDSYVIGNNNIVNANKVMVLGNNVEVVQGHDGGVVLGDDSTIEHVHQGPLSWDGHAVAGRQDVGTEVVSIGKRGKERQIQNVAPGVVAPNSTDAINGSQLYGVAKMASAGIAGAIAQASIPSPTRAGVTAFGAGTGYFSGQAALAIGMSSVSDNGKWVLKGNVSADSGGRVSAGAGVLYQW